MKSGLKNVFDSLGAGVEWFRALRVLLLKKLYPPHPNNRRINVGGGSWYYPRWEVIDLYAPRVFTDYRVDLRGKTSFPLPDNCAQYIFSSHTLEHISDEACRFVLKECHRILKTGGVIRISVPDMDKALQAYQSNDYNFFYSGEVGTTGNSLEKRLVSFLASYRRGDHAGGPDVNDDLIKKQLRVLSKHEFAKWCVSLIPPDASYTGHINAYDFEKIKSLLVEAGFKFIERSFYRHSTVAEMRKKQFDNRPNASLFIEGVKS